MHGKNFPFLLGCFDSATQLTLTPELIDGQTINTLIYTPYCDVSPLQVSLQVALVLFPSLLCVLNIVNILLL